MGRPKSYPIIGGPLDGKTANQADFYKPYRSPINPAWHRSGGKYGYMADEYLRYNAGDRQAGFPSMLWLHKSLVP